MSKWLEAAEGRSEITRLIIFDFLIVKYIFKFLIRVDILALFATVKLNVLQRLSGNFQKNKLTCRSQNRDLNVSLDKIK